MNRDDIMQKLIDDQMEAYYNGHYMDSSDARGQLSEFAQLIVYDFLSELTNDDSLGEARIATIKRLAEKWGVSR